MTTIVTSNKLALISFSAVLVIFLVLVDIFMVIEERDFLLQLEKNHAEEDMESQAGGGFYPGHRSQWVCGGTISTKARFPACV